MVMSKKGPEAIKQGEKERPSRLLHLASPDKDTTDPSILHSNRNEKKQAQHLRG
jgi:hypothetical protein